MTVEELIVELKKHPQNAEVGGEGFILGYEKVVGVAYEPKDEETEKPRVIIRGRLR